MRRNNNIILYLYTLYVCIYISKLVSRLTIVEGDPKAPFSIATTLRCRGGHYSFPWITPLTFDPYLIMLSVKQGGIKYHFLSLWYDLTKDWTPSFKPMAYMYVCIVNPCGLFNAKSCSYMYMKYMICKIIICRKQFLNMPEFICLHTVK